MNNNIITILKKQFNDLKPSNLVVKNGKVKFEVFTSIFIAFISLILIAAVVYVLNAFTNSYCIIKINRVLDIQAREYELLNPYTRYGIYFQDNMMKFNDHIGI